MPIKNKRAKKTVQAFSCGYIKIERYQYYLLWFSEVDNMHALAGGSKRRKRIVGLIIAAAMVLGLYGCSFIYERGREAMMTEECKAIVDFLHCDYELLANEKNIIRRFNELTVQGKEDGFYPLIIIPSDTMVGTLEFSLEYNNIENTQEGIAAYRQTVIEAAQEIDAAEFLSTRLNEDLKSLGEYDILGQFVQTEPYTELALPMRAEAAIIAKIPANNPWELAAWIPMGGFNDCPAPQAQAAVFRYWYDKYGAVPAVVTSDIWEMTLSKPPVAEKEAEALAKEHYAFCPDTVLQGAESIRGLASALKDSTLWYFWWD